MDRQPLATYRSDAGTEVEVTDESSPYGYSNLYHVKLRVSVQHPGEEEPFEKLLERMGVYDTELEQVRGELLNSFEANALPYLLRADFPAHLARSRGRRKQKVVWFRGAP